jgi:hypothetical protein
MHEGSQQRTVTRSSLESRSQTGEAAARVAASAAPSGLAEMEPRSSFNAVFHSSRFFDHHERRTAVTLRPE